VASTSAEKKNKYFYGLGRRKSSVAQVRLFKGAGNMAINEKPADEYVKPASLIQEILKPLKKLGQESNYDIMIHVRGGGFRGQVDAMRLGVARALLKIDAQFRKELKSQGFLRRDPRIIERKKYGLKKARKAPQYTKR
jgi:small subunit ribosomal protein S9